VHLKANDLNFSRHGSDESSEIQAKTQVDIVCTNGTPFTLTGHQQRRRKWNLLAEAGKRRHGRAEDCVETFADEGKQTQITGTNGWTIPATVRNRKKRQYGVIDAER
jgi:hypothetical protein